MKTLCIVTNEKSKFYNGKVCFENKIIETLISGLQYKYDIVFCAPYKADNIRNYCISTNNILFRWSNIFINFIKLYNKKTDIVLILSISPFTIIIKLFYIIFVKSEIFLYIQSDREKEYEIKIGKIGFLLFNILKIIAEFNSTIIEISNTAIKKDNKFYIKPSVIDDKWFVNRCYPTFNENKVDLLYVGRIRVEKGIYSLINIINRSQIDIHLSIVGSDIYKVKHKNIISLGYISNEKHLITHYDEHDIVVVPSYTESYSKVIDESLSRLRPVIIFNEVSHLSINRFGVFVCKRTVASFDETIQFIKREHNSIINSMNNNTFQTKQDYLRELKMIIN